MFSFFASKYHFFSFYSLWDTLLISKKPRSTCFPIELCSFDFLKLGFSNNLSFYSLSFSFKSSLGILLILLNFNMMPSSYFLCATPLHLFLLCHNPLWSFGSSPLILQPYSSNFYFLSKLLIFLLYLFLFRLEFWSNISQLWRPFRWRFDDQNYNLFGRGTTSLILYISLTVYSNLTLSVSSPNVNLWVLL